VVIPTRNRWLMLRSAVWSALHQEGCAARVVVVDDDSTDETPERLAGVQNDAVTVLRTPSRVGVSAARNLGLEQVTTEWVAFLDDDDVWAPFHLSCLLDAIGCAEDAGPRVDLAYSGSLYITSDRAVTHVKEPPPPVDVPSQIFTMNVLSTPSRVLLRTSSVRAAGGFDTGLSVTADWDLWLRVMRDSAVAASSALSVGYTRHGANMHLAVGDALRELPQLEERYTRATQDGDHSFTANCSRWIATSYRVAGDRRRAALWYVRTFRHHRRLRDLGRAVGVLLGEKVIARSGLQHQPRIPADIAPWLGAVRQVDLLPPGEIPFAVGQ